MTRLCSRSLLSLALSLLASPVLAQLTVGPPGSGAMFGQISSALAAANIGDTILVEPGTYQSFIVSQGVSIVGSGSDSTFIHVPFASSQGMFDVVGIPADQLVRISGFSRVAAARCPDADIEVVNCAGRVELVDLLVPRPGITFDGEPTARIVGSNTVVIDGCRFLGSRDNSQVLGLPAATALFVDNSSLWINGSHIHGGRGRWGDGGPALEVSNSFVHVSGSHLEGGYAGFIWGSSPQGSHQPAEGIRVTNSEVILVGGSGNRVRGADGINHTFFNYPPGASAIELGGSATVRYASDVVLEPGMNSADSGIAPAFELIGGANLTVLESDVRASLRVDPAGARPGTGIELEAYGRPFGTTVVFGATSGMKPIPLGGGRHFHIAPGGAIRFATLALDATGTAIVPISVPPNAALAGFTLVLQGLELDPVVQRVTNPALFTVLQ